MLILEVQKKTIFAKLLDVYPECGVLIDGEPQLHPLMCLRSHCHRAQNCMEKLVHRVKFIFDQFDEAQLLLLYFRYADRPGSHRAGVFWRDLQEPRLITFNRTAWEKLKKIGVVFEWNLPPTMFLTGTQGDLSLSKSGLTDPQSNLIL